jgi:hypothetical protein
MDASNKEYSMSTLFFSPNQPRQTLPSRWMRLGSVLFMLVYRPHTLAEIFPAQILAEELYVRQIATPPARDMKEIMEINNEDEKNVWYQCQPDCIASGCLQRS